MSELTLKQQIDRAEAAIEVEKVMGRHCYYHAAGIHREEFFEMWSAREDITWTHFFGKMGNRDEYFGNYVIQQEKNTFANYRRLWDIYPEVRKVPSETRRMMDYRALLEEPMHLLTTPIIEVSEDGQSAQCLWYTPGLIFSRLNPQKSREGGWMWERYGADFVKEGDEWLYLDLRICPDAGVAVMDCYPWTGEGTYVMQIQLDDEGKPIGMEIPGSVGGISLPGPLFEEYTPSRVPPKEPAIPVPYKTASEVKRYCEVQRIEGAGPMFGM